MNIRQLLVNKKRLLLSVTPPTAPSQVSLLVATTIGTTSVTVAYGAATGSSVISYTGWTSPHGTNTWTLNFGAFSPTGGTFVGLTANTSYDLRIVATNTAGTSNTDLASILTAPAGTAPGNVTGFQLGVVSTTTIAVSYAAASGSPTITYAGWTSLHGANSWTLNGGSFGATGGNFTGLTPSTNYDLRIVATNSFGSSSTDFTTGYTTATPAPNPITPSNLVVTRTDLILGASSGAVGGALTATIYPNGPWNGNGSASLTLTGTGWTFPSGPSAVIPSSGTTPITISATPSTTGELSLSVTNTGGLANPYYAPFNCFASSPGSTQAITGAAISSAPGGGSNLDLQPFQRDAPSGNPNGWGTTFGKGWGEVWVTLTLASVTTAIYAKLVDSDSNSYLQSTSVQVYGSLASGTHTIRLLVPASNRRYFLELSTDTGFSNPTRLPQRFFVGIVLAFGGPSQQAGMLRGYAYSGTIPTGVNYTKTVTLLSTNGFYPTDTGGWFQHDSSTANPGSTQLGEGSSSAVQEWGRTIEAKFGVLTAIVGGAWLGVGTDTYIAQSGNVATWAFAVPVQRVNNKFRYVWWNLANNASYDTYDYAAATAANVGYMAANYPAAAVIGYNFGATGIFGNDGSRVTGYTRLSVQVAMALAAGDPRVVSLDDYHWNRYFGGHASMASRIQYARTGYRAFADAELSAFGGNQTSAHGPTLANVGSIAAGSRILRIFGKYHGGASVTPIAINFSAANGTSPESFTYTSDVTIAELASLFSVFGPGGYTRNGTPIQITGAVISTASLPTGYDFSIDLTLAGSTGVLYADNSTGAMPANFNVHYAADFYVSCSGGGFGDSGRAIVVFDDQADGVSGLPGRHLKPAVDIVVSQGSIPTNTSGPLPAFTLRNWAGSSSNGFARVGMPFKQGDVPAGSIPTIAHGTLQLDARTTYPDGSLKYGVAHIRDTAFTASEARSFQFGVSTGSFSNTGTLNLSTLLSGHDFKVLFTAVQQYDGTSSVQRGSGSFTASLATHAAVATRVTKIHSGGVCEGWVVWGMATDNSGGAADAHLKVYWHIDAWKNSDGSVYAIEIVPVISQDWWSVANKFMLLYDASFQDGGTVITSFPGVHHPYHSRWAMIRTTADNNMGRRPWTGGAIPTLHYEPDRTYWVSTGLVPPFDLTLSPGGLRSDLPAFSPCGNLDHRPAIDGTGAYMGRGLVPFSDAVAFMRQLPLDTAIARVEAHAGLHIPYHCRSNRNRTRPGESADIASTIVAQKLDNPNRAAGWDNCTADGMPVPVYAYFGYYTDSAMADSYVGAAGGWGVWSNQTNDASHAVAYSYFMYLFEGEEYFLEAMLSHTTYTAHQAPGGGATPSAGTGYGIRGLLLAGDSAYASLSIPTGIYAGLPGIWKPSNGRAICFSINLLGQGGGLIRADHVAYNYMQKWVAHIGDWIGGSLQYMPTSQRAFGAFYPKSWFDGIPGQGRVPVWFMGLIALGSYNAYRLTGDTRYRDLGDSAANMPIGVFASGRNYMNDQYMVGDRPKASDWVAGTNEYYAPSNIPVFNLTAAVTDHTNGIIRMDLAEGFGQNQSGGWLTMTNGDKWATSSFSGAFPPELPEGQVFYVRDVTVHVGGLPDVNCTFKLATTPGGSPLTYAANSTGEFQTQWWPQDAVHPVSVNPPYVIPSDSYAPMQAAAVEMAAACGNVAASASVLSKERTFMSTTDRGAWMPWALKAP
jgi:hypothetical protein